MQTIKRTIIRLEQGETVTIEAARGNLAFISIDVKADYRGDDSQGTPMLLVNTSDEMFDDDSKEICFATIEPR